MREVYNGKIYDTDKAEEIASRANGYYKSDHGYYEESLYRTPKGTWFLAGEGGPASHYAERVGNASIGGSGVTPISEVDAFNWLQDYQFIEKLEHLFGDQVEEA